MKLRFYAIPLALVALCGALALGIRFSTTHESDDLQNFSLDVMANYPGEELDEYWQDAMKENGTLPPSTPQELESEAAVIVRAGFGGERTAFWNGLYSQVTVKQVYKGPEELAGKTLCVVEEIGVFPGFLNTGETVYTPLRQGDDYLLFLKPVEFDPARKLTPLQKQQYYPVSKSVLGAYRIAPEQQTKLFGENDTVTLGEMEKNGWDVATSSREMLDYYYRFRGELFQTYGIDPAKTKTS